MIITTTAKTGKERNTENKRQRQRKQVRKITTEDR